MKVPGMRRVAPDSPARLIRCEQLGRGEGEAGVAHPHRQMLQNIHTEKATIRAGIDTSRLRQATRLWPPAQAAGSSGVQVRMFDMVASRAAGARAPLP